MRAVIFSGGVRRFIWRRGDLLFLLRPARDFLLESRCLTLAKRRDVLSVIRQELLVSGKVKFSFVNTQRGATFAEIVT